MLYPFKTRPNHTASALFLAVAGILLFQFQGNAVQGYIATQSLFYWWGSQWFSEGSDMEHGPLLLGVSLFLFFREIRSRQFRPGEPAWRMAGILMASALGMHAIGFLAQQTRISIVACLLFAAGWMALAGGRPWLRAALFPLALLLFTIPMGFLTDELGLFLRLGVIEVVERGARAVGIDVIRNGTQLLAPDGSYNYDVAPACSGIRSLMALSSLSFLIGYFSFRGWGRRLLLLVLALPFAFAGNILRIGSIVVAAHWLGQEAGDLVHSSFGFIIFLVVLGLAMGTVALLTRFAPEKQLHGSAQEESAAPQAGDFTPRTIPPRASLTFGGVAALGILAVGIINERAETLSGAPACGIILAANGIDPVPLPSMIGLEWAGMEFPVTAVERDYLPDDTGFSRRNFVNLEDSRRRIAMSIVLSGRDRTSIHRPELCLRGQGWKIAGRFSHRFSDETMDIPATVLRIERDFEAPDGTARRVHALFAYWFVGGDRIVATHRERLWQTAIDRVLHLRTHRWGYVFCQALVLQNEETTLSQIDALVRETAPQFQEVLDSDA